MYTSKNRMRRILIILPVLFYILPVFSQDRYNYYIDLTQVKDDKLEVRLDVPAIKQKEIIFSIPKIIPGTYRISDYGKFAKDIKALDKSGKALKVEQVEANSWKISGADKLTSIQYWVEDTYDTQIPNAVFPMAGTNIDEGKNFVLNPFGFFGYFQGMKNLPVHLSVKKPEGFYGSTGLIPESTGANQDKFTCTNVDEFYDAPIMYNIPDTTTIQVGNCKVLISVYAPKKQVESKFIAANLNSLLQATRHYLGGKLPVDKYAFIYYFNDPARPVPVSGALEHSFSSFYFLNEAPQQSIIAQLVDVSAHEFFHIITPLTIASKEVKDFDYNKPDLSKHLWLYEGSTEYASDHVQVKYGLNTIDQFFQKLSIKIRNSKSSYRDNLPFTELSKEAAGVHGVQFPNVYEKGALISACLDIYLLHLSDGHYGLRELKHDLGVKYGRSSYFNDDELFDVITSLTYPEVRTFFRKYVEGNESVPYADFFAMAGVLYEADAIRKDYSMGGIGLGSASATSPVTITNTSSMNAFGKSMGYQTGDIIVSFNGIVLNPATMQQDLDKAKATLKEGEIFKAVVVRNVNGKTDTLTLTAPVIKVDFPEKHRLSFLPSTNAKQSQVRSAWLSVPGKPVRPAPPSGLDVVSKDNILKALYEVISGPPGERNWERFRSLFHPQAYMGATATDPSGTVRFRSFTPEEYVRNNGPFFKSSGFFEEEIGRSEDAFGNIVQVFSAYQYRFQQNGPVQKRGINSIQLVNENGRWWIANIIWNEESQALPIPEKYLGKK